MARWIESRLQPSLLHQNDTLYGSGVNEFVFEAIDCTSPPLFRNSFLNSNLLPSDTVVGGPNPAQAGGGGNNIVYIPDPNDTPRLITTLARASRSDGGA